MPEEINRRTFVAGSLLSSASIAISGAAQGATGSQAASPTSPKAGLPRGKIGKLELSRLILGGNLLTHFTHSRDLRYDIKTYHSHSYPTAPKPEQIKGPLNEFPGYWCSNPQETADFMRTVQKPWIAFKTMAAGAIPPRQAFRRAFASGADFVLAGMFDFEIAEDAQIAQDAAATHRDRQRPWRA